MAYRDEPGNDRSRTPGGGDPGGTLFDPNQEFYQPPFITTYDSFGNVTGRQPNPLYTGGGGGGAPMGGANNGAPAAGTTGATGAGGAATGAATAGGLSGWLRLAGQLAPILSSIAGDRAAGRQAAGQANQNQARAAADIFRTRMDASLKGPRTSASDAAYGDTLANIQPFSWTGANKMVGNIPVPQSTGGMGPQNFGPATRSAGASLATLGASRVNSPSFNLPEPPTLSDLPQAGLTDSILGNAGYLTSILGAFNTLRNNTGRMPRATDPNYDANGGYIGP